MNRQTNTNGPVGLGRRQFLGWTGSRGLALGVGAVGLPALLAACGGDDDDGAGSGAATTAPSGAAVSEAQAAEEARAIVGDVVDFGLTSDDWPGAFGFVTFQVRRGAVGGNDVYFVRTDTSDEDFAETEELVFVPKLASLTTGDGLTGAMYRFEDAGDDQPVVLSAEPGSDGYTPAWTLHRVTWSSEPRVLRSVQEIEDAEAAGALAVEQTNIVVNAGIVKWSSGEMPVDTERTEYLGSGMLLEPVDTTALRATFKLGQCFPGSRYFALDHSIAPMAEMTQTVFSPGLHTVVSEAGRHLAHQRVHERPGGAGAHGVPALGLRRRRRRRVLVALLGPLRLRLERRRHTPRAHLTGGHPRGPRRRRGRRVPRLARHQRRGLHRELSRARARSAHLRTPDLTGHLGSRAAHHGCPVAADEPAGGGASMQPPPAARSSSSRTMSRYAQPSRSLGSMTPPSCHSFQA
jgi:hypothetical protein